MKQLELSVEIFPFAYWSVGLKRPKKFEDDERGGRSRRKKNRADEEVGSGSLKVQEAGISDFGSLNSYNILLESIVRHQLFAPWFRSQSSR